MKLNFRKYMVLWVGGALCLVLLGVSGALLVRYASVYQRVTRELIGEQRRLDDLRRRKPFPNEENIRRLEENRVVLQEVFGVLMERLTAGQYEPPQLEPARFPDELARMQERLRARAVERKVRMAPTLAYGFDRYFKGELPRREEVPRLLVQVKAVEEVCGALLDAGIVELSKVEREAFETVLSPTTAEVPTALGYDALTAAIPGERTVTLTATAGRDPSGLFSWERIGVEFQTREAGLWDALSGLARSPTFIVVSSITVTNATPRPPLKTTVAEERTTLALPGAATMVGRPTVPVAESAVPGDGPPKSRPPPREARIVAGREELLNVRIEADVYRFERLQQAEP